MDNGYCASCCGIVAFVTRIACWLLTLGACGAHASTQPSRSPRSYPPSSPAPAIEDTRRSGAFPGELVSNTTVTVDAGEIDTLDAGHAIYRDPRGALRAFPISPRDVRSDGQHPSLLAIEDRALLDGWDVRWIASRGGLYQLEARRRGEVVERWGASTDARLARRDVKTSDALFSIEVTLVRAEGQADRPGGRIEVLVRETELAAPAKLGQALAPGKTYVSLTGLRVHLEKTSECEFDPSVPCPFGGSYRAHAARGGDEAHVDLKAARTKVLGHVIELGRGTFAIRR